MLADATGGAPQVLLLATGSEVEIALAAYEQLTRDGIAVRVVSMPCMEYFAAQPQAYRDEVLPPAVTRRIAIEAAASQSWWRWVGEHGVIVGLDHFGASAPYQRIYKEFGLTAERLIAEAKALVSGAARSA